MLIVLGLFISKCPSPRPSNITSEYSSDTTIIYKSDTIKIYDTLIKTIKVYINKPTIIYLPSDSNSLDSVSINQYITKVNDSIIEGSIYSQVEGILKNQELLYKLKLPLQIIIRDSIFSTINTIHTIRDNRIAFISGIESGGNINTFDFSLIGGLKLQNDWDILYRYGIISKTHSVGITKSFPIGK